MNEFESYFLSFVKYKLSNHNNYLQFSNQECFPMYIRDIMKILSNNIVNNLNNNYSNIMINRFYDFMIKDQILNNIDLLGFSSLVIKLKLFAENNATSKEDQYVYFEALKRKYLIPYEKELFNMVVKEIEGPSGDFERYHYLSENMLNILIFIHDYRFLKYCFFDKDRFQSISEVINHLFFGKDDINIFIPVKNNDSFFLDFLDSSSQKYEFKDEILYLALHDGSRTNFYSIVVEQMRRIDSLMNLYRLFHDTKTDYYMGKNLIIESVFFDAKIEMLFQDVLMYQKNKLQSKNFNTLANNLNSLKELDGNLYRKLINSISYAEKNRDEISINSFIDNWISLESLTSICNFKNSNTLDSVIRFVSEAIISKMIMTDLNYIFKDSRRSKMNIETFTKMSLNKTISYYIDKETDLYKKHILINYSVVLSDIKLLNKYFKKIELNLERDLTRIYTIRNEFVHENNININFLIEGKKLKFILLMLMDEVFKNLDQKIDHEDQTLFGRGRDIYTTIRLKYENREHLFKLLSEKTVLRDLNLSSIVSKMDISYDLLVTNIILNNKHLFKEYVPKKEYENKKAERLKSNK